MFQLTNQTEVKLCSMTPRTEKHGDEDVSAVSLSLRLTGPNTLLDTLQPGLRDALYKAVDGSVGHPGAQADDRQGDMLTPEEALAGSV